jgi:hypothetical protein
MVEGWPAERFAEAFAPFFADHATIRLDPTARSPEKTRVTRRETEGVWDVVQVVSDDEGDDDWALHASIDLAPSAQQARPVMTLRELSR